MASTFCRSMNCRSISSLRSCISRANTGTRHPPPIISSPAGSARTATGAASRSASLSSNQCFRGISRSPVELGSCVGSMYPLHSAVAVARLTSRLSLTSRSCRDISQGTLCRTSPGL